MAYFVTLKILSNRSARRTLIPKEVPGLMAAHTTSKMLPTMTCNGQGLSAVLHARICAQLSPAWLPLSASTPHLPGLQLKPHRALQARGDLQRAPRSCCPCPLPLHPDTPGDVD